MSATAGIRFQVGPTGCYNDGDGRHNDDDCNNDKVKIGDDD